jgi:DNA-binding NtrC family response regulator
MSTQSFRLSPPAMRILCEYSWPGNVRELENIIQSLMVNCDSEGSVEAEDLPDHIRKNDHLRSCSGMSLEEAKVNFEREFLKQALNHHRWNKTQTARDLKITRQGLINMIQRLGLKEQAH